MINSRGICNWRVPARRALASAVLIAGLASCADANQSRLCLTPSSDAGKLAPFGLPGATEGKPCRVSGWLGAEFHGSMPSGDRQLQYVAFLPGGTRHPEAFIVYIPGGPGAKILDGFDLTPGPKTVVSTIAWQCRAAVLVPAYAGTADFSNYPDSSIDEAILDVEAFLARVRETAAGRPVILLTASLGTYIYASSSKGQIDAHIAMVPLLRSPEGFMRFVINDNTRGGYQEIARNRWKTYQIGIPQMTQSIRVVDFARAFYGQRKANAISLAEAYGRNPASQKELQSTRFFVGIDDSEVGPYGEFQGQLVAAGLVASSLQIPGHSVDEASASAIVKQSESLLPESCSR